MRLGGAPSSAARFAHLSTSPLISLGKIIRGLKPLCSPLLRAAPYPLSFILRGWKAGSA